MFTNLCDQVKRSSEQCKGPGPISRRNVLRRIFIFRNTSMLGAEGLLLPRSRIPAVAHASSAPNHSILVVLARRLLEAIHAHDAGRICCACQTFERDIGLDELLSADGCLLRRQGAKHHLALIGAIGNSCEPASQFRPSGEIQLLCAYELVQYLTQPLRILSEVWSMSCSGNALPQLAWRQPRQVLEAGGKFCKNFSFNGITSARL